MIFTAWGYHQRVSTDKEDECLTYEYAPCILVLGGKPISERTLQSSHVRVREKEQHGPQKETSKVLHFQVPPAQSCNRKTKKARKAWLAKVGRALDFKNQDKRGIAALLQATAVWKRALFMFPGMNLSPTLSEASTHLTIPHHL